MKGLIFLVENNFVMAEKYLAHCYEVPTLPKLPLAAEDFVWNWWAVEKIEAIKFFSAL